MKHFIFSEQTESSHDEVEDGIKKISKRKNFELYPKGKKGLKCIETSLKFLMFHLKQYLPQESLNLKFELNM